ncbi:hypothetical protein PR202_ga13731 [Eleusine coracana subsp. coracana]|uniref:VQ domain-containing protein n=1 Tax=Eleusine coracana subsp. coracana TaxID=191504 RepID=A0AAV5CFI0_ELECO|nr:hypothetical protein QOZ80_3AG0213210 [Eleusine coracana subsp. coracana]GJM96860.1 hypothetical protein PR202_ga13731 [Eleusine coracana subsp. coracana]
MTMTMAMPSSEASSSPSKRGGLRGPRPQPLKVTSSSRGSSPASKPSSSRKAPVIVYENTPKVVHARPQEFMTVVQRLTGKPASAATSSSVPPYAPASFSTAATGVEEGGDPLLLTLGQRPVAPTPMAAGGLLMSPSFIFSPNTMQSIQELSSLF